MMAAIVHEYFDIKQFYIMAIPDSNRNSIWPAHAIDLVPPFEVIFTNNPLVQELFSNLSNKEIRSIPLIKRENLSGKEIRKRMVEGKEWQSLVPEVIVPLIDKYHGVERLKKIVQDDY